MRESIEIVYNGISSAELGGIQIHDDGGLFTEQFVADKSIVEEKIRGRDEPYFYGVEREPLSFTLSFWFDTELSVEKKREIARWLDQDYYKPLYTVDNPERIYYAMCTDSSEHIHNGIEFGYVTLNFRTNSPYAFSPVYEKEFDFSNNTENGMEFVFDNKGDVICKPYLKIKMLEDGDLTIINMTNRGREFKFVELAKNELLEIDCIREVITSDTLLSRYNNFNGNYLEFLPYRENHLKVFGKCIIKMKYQFKFK